MTDRRLFMSDFSSLSGLSASAFTRSDYWRRAPPQSGESVLHKEWSHFCAATPELDVIINFSLMEHVWCGGAEIPRVTMIVRHDRNVWEGDVVQYAPGEAIIGQAQTNIDIGGNAIRFADPAYHVKAAIESGALRADLRFRPVARPALASSVRLSGRQRMRWLVVPRLVAEGEIVAGGRSFMLKDAPAYHDRNWGHFRWGENFSWEWATILPDSQSVPWSLVYMRISDGTRNRTYSQGLMVWRGANSKRVFHGGDIRLRQADWLKQDRVLRLPRIVNLMIGGQASPVPRGLDIEARAWTDYIDATLAFEDMAQVGVPNDGPDGLTLLSEVTGAAEVAGRVDGEEVQFHGRVLMEFNHAG
jgi:hypothetical protein